MMADQKKWFKVWTSITNDPHFQEMSLENIGRWALLGALMAEVGSHGKLRTPRSVKRLQQLMRCNGVEETMEAISTLTGVQIEEGKTDNDEITVTWKNWLQYQEDSTVALRVKRLREKRREEEKRREKNVMQTPEGSGAAVNGFSAWPTEWDPIKTLLTGSSALPFLARYNRWLADLDWWVTMREVFSSCPAPLERLLTEAAGYIQGEGYRPRTAASIRQKLRNCMEFSAQKAERKLQQGDSTRDPYAHYKRV